jgi:glycosyltransferase involved in cell wall biosynthesis
MTTAIVTHHATTGPADALEDYLRGRRACLVVVEHGFGELTGAGTTVRVWRGGRLVRTRRFRWTARLPGPAAWVKDVALSLAVPVWARGRVDEYIGLGSLNAAAGIVLRALGLSGPVVFWTIDYAPRRFGNDLLNRVYLALDRLCVTRCSETWNLSPRMEEVRRARGVEGPQRVVPMGANARPPRPAVHAHRLVHMGSLLEKQGVQVAVRALPLVRHVVPDVSLLVVGGGPYRRALESLVRELGLDEAVRFTGYVGDHAEVEELIAESAVALATYDPDLADFTRYADPGKIKTYLACGVPVVATAVPWSAEWLASAGAGLVVDYRPEDVARGILALLDDSGARAAAARLGSECDWQRIFDDAFGTRG